MSAAATANVWQRATMSGSRLVVLLAVADVVNDMHGNLFWMNSNKLAHKCNMSAGNVRKALKYLVDEGWLVVEKQGGGSGQSTIYRFIPVDKSDPRGAVSGIKRSDGTYKPRPDERHIERTKNEHKENRESPHHVTDPDAVDSTQHTNHTHHPPDLVDQNLAGIRAARTELDLPNREPDDNYRTPEPTHPRHGARTTDRNDPEGQRENRELESC
tara:strand:- start:680 stop:1321 length:642 start_codon:yes stop_codon:yes gene_type:complete